MHCLTRCCCDAVESDDEENSSRGRSRNSSRHALGPVRMSRRVTPINSIETQQLDFQPVAVSSEDVNAAIMIASVDHATAPGTEDDDDDDVCCPGSPVNNHVRGINDFFRKLRDSWQRYDSLETEPPLRDDEPLGKDIGPSGFGSPLRTALSFDSRRGIPTINNEEVVLPGSDLQKEMAVAMSSTLETQEDECVICMEIFDATNPRMPTLCGCGQNKTFFHLPCLYQWIEQSRSCPSCRQRLRWEEF